MPVYGKSSWSVSHPRPSPAPNGASEGLHFCHLPRVSRAFPSSGPVRRLWGHIALGWASEQGERALGFGEGEVADHRHTQPEAQSSAGEGEGQEWKQGWEERVQPKCLRMNQEHPRGLMVNRMVRTTPLGKILPGKHPRH